MQTECNGEQLGFQAVGRREVVARFDGGQMTSDGGGLLLREVERGTAILKRLAQCFGDHRDPAQIEHTLEELIGQRVVALALGYEDLNDHDQLRNDPLMGILVNRTDPGRPLAGKSTLNRLELSVADGEKDRYKKIEVDEEAVDRFLVDVFIGSLKECPTRIVLDLDTTADVIHGHQEGRHFLTHYDEYCYMPLYIFSGEHLLCARLRQANVDAAAGSVEEVKRIVAQIRQVWPDVKIMIRADSGFTRDEVMLWCEQNGVDYVLGLPKNSRLEAEIEAEMADAKAASESSGAPVRRYKILNIEP